jgi:pilus assembly protein CpaF
MSAGLLDAVRQRLAESGADPTPARVAAALRAQGRLLGDAEVLGAARELRSELVGAGPLEPLLADPEVTDVLVAAPDRVWVDRGGGLELAPVRFEDAGAVRRLAQRLAAVAGRRLDDARPWVDARLPDGTRLHAVLPPVAVGSACLSLRVVRPRAFTLDELVAAGTLPPGGQRVLRALIEARLSFLISGGTGTGKTTLLSALLGLVGPGERIVLAEDSAELRPDHPHVVRLETRPPTRRAPGSWASPTSCGRRCGCGPTGSWWARSAGRRWPTSSRPSTPATKAARARSTPTPRRTFRRGSRRWARRPGWTGPRCTASWRPP